uniref:Uncharacterized protein n=1 Tax=Triticum urartu TaxID=4572 RepID=A0A8R7U1C8_TRIUA
MSPCAQLAVVATSPFFFLRVNYCSSTEMGRSGLFPLLSPPPLPPPLSSLSPVSSLSTLAATTHPLLLHHAPSSPLDQVQASRCAQAAALHSRAKGGNGGGGRRGHPRL